MRLFSVRLMTVTGKFGLSIGRLTQWTNRQGSPNSPVTVTSRALKFLHVNVPLEKFYHLYFSRFFHLHSCSADKNI